MRYIIKVCGFIIDINFVKIQYKCDVCKNEIQNEIICRNGCTIKQPILNLQVLCVVQDGTSKASIELKNEKCIKAFGITDNIKQTFKDYCLKMGTFIFPSNQHSYQYKDIQNIFKKNETWN